MVSDNVSAMASKLTRKPSNAMAVQHTPSMAMLAPSCTSLAELAIQLDTEAAHTWSLFSETTGNKPRVMPLYMGSI